MVEVVLQKCLLEPEKNVRLGCMFKRLRDVNIGEVFTVETGFGTLKAAKIEGHKILNLITMMVGEWNENDTVKVIGTLTVKCI